MRDRHTFSEVRKLLRFFKGGFQRSNNKLILRLTYARTRLTFFSADITPSTYATSSVHHVSTLTFNNTKSDKFTLSRRRAKFITRSLNFVLLVHPNPTTSTHNVRPPLRPVPLPPEVDPAPVPPAPALLVPPSLPPHLLHLRLHLNVLQTPLHRILPPPLKQHPPRPRRRKMRLQPPPL